MTDRERERVIECYRRVLVDAPNKKTKRIAAVRMRELIAQRPPVQTDSQNAVPVRAGRSL